jgi:ribose transport system ATP-binding protein
MSAAASRAAALSVRGIGKRYAAPVLQDVDLDLRAGEVHALMGENGAGKSTLSRILTGLTTPDAGTMSLAGAPFAPRSRREAQRAGVQIVLQELHLVPTLSVAENLFLTDLPRRGPLIDRDALAARAREALDALGLDALDPWTPVSRLGIGRQQLVALAAALAHPCRVLVLDEPTAALTAAETELAFAHVERLRATGAAILYISHRLDEIQRVADRITVLRDGRVVGGRAARETSMAEIVALMVGEARAETAPAATSAPGAVALRVEGLTRGDRVRDVSLEVRAGEILGLAGLIGSGRTETLRAIAGADRPEAGRVSVGSRPVPAGAGAAGAVRAGIGMVPEDRRADALLLTQPIRSNVTLAGLDRVRRGPWIDRAGEAAVVEALCAQLDVRCRSIEQPAGELSGGNQQKVVLARWLLRDCEVLLVDEPTRGVDVAAKRAVHDVLRGLAARGRALVVVSSELPELLALCDRIAVMSDGRLVTTFARGEWSEAAIVEAAFSGYARGAVAATEAAPC